MQTVLEPSRSLSVFRQIGSHEIERRSRQGSVQSSERPSGGVTIQRGHNPEGRIQRVALEEDREEGEQ